MNISVFSQHPFSTTVDSHMFFQSFIIPANCGDPQGSMLGPLPVRLSPPKSDKYQQHQLYILPFVPSLSVASHQSLAVQCKCN